MSEKPPPKSETPPSPSKRPSKKPAGASGQHPAVKAYRKKLESIDMRVSDAQNELDRELDQFLSDLKTIPPEKEKEPDSGEREKDQRGGS